MFHAEPWCLLKRVCCDTLRKVTGFTLEPGELALTGIKITEHGRWEWK